jgi:hypothetical protein
MKPHLGFWYSRPQTPIPAAEHQINPISNLLDQDHISNSEKKVMITHFIAQIHHLFAIYHEDLNQTPDPDKRNPKAELGIAWFCSKEKVGDSYNLY